MKPLHGEKTHPPSEAALGILRQLRQGAIPRHDINPGIANRLLREALVESVQMRSPYKTVKGQVAHLRITDAGLQASDTRKAGIG